MYEKFEMKSGETFILYSPSVSFFVDDRYVSGICSDEEGQRTSQTLRFPYKLVARHVPLKFDGEKLVEDLESYPRSIRAA